MWKRRCERKLMRGRRQLTQLVIYLGDHRGYKIGNELTKDGEWVWTLGKVVRQRSHQDGKSQKHCYPQWYFLSWFWWQPKHQQCHQRQNKGGKCHVDGIVERLPLKMDVVVDGWENQIRVLRGWCEQVWFRLTLPDKPLTALVVLTVV